MPKTMKDLKDGGKLVTSLDPLDLLLTARSPFGVNDDGVIEWGALQNHIMDFLSYQISPSVASNNLTVAIKTRNGSDASATNPIKFVIGTTVYTVSAAVSYTKNAGTNWHNSGSAEMAAKDVDYFVYAIGETGASAGLKFGHSRIPFARTMGDFVNTTTHEKYIAGNWTNFNSTDPVIVIGRFRARLSASASFNWSIPNALVIHRPIYVTDWLSWTPQFPTAGSMTFGTVTITQAVYKAEMDKLTVSLDFNGTTGGVAGAYIHVSTPFKLNATKMPGIPYFPCYHLDGTPAAGFMRYYLTGYDGIQVSKQDESVAWGLGAGRYIRGTLIFAI